jgi:hypothetical protein
MSTSTPKPPFERRTAYLYGGLIGVIAVALAVGLTYAATSTPALPSPPEAVAPATACQPDPSAAIAAVPAGGVWQGSGCYDIPTNILLTKAITIEPNPGSKLQFNDTATGPTKLTGQELGVKPIVQITGATGVTLKNLTLSGTNPGGAIRHKNLVGEAGIDVVGSTNVTIDKVSVQHVGGDGLTLAFEPNHAENTNVTVNGLKVTDVNRECVTVAYAQDSTLGSVDCNGGVGGIDFESDLPNIGSSNVHVVNFMGTKSIRIVENLQGPIFIDQPDYSGTLNDFNEAGMSGQPVTVTGGSIALPRRVSGAIKGGMLVEGPSTLTLTGVALGLQPGQGGKPRTATAPTWYLTGGAHLVLDHSTYLGPKGYNDSTSTVSITP